MGKKISYGSQITKVETLSDGSVKVTIVTAKEMSPEDMTALFSFRNKQAYTLHSEIDDFDESDIPNEKPDFSTGGKTQAQRLRGVIYRIWEQTGKKVDSESYYRSTMEQIISQMKEKLE